MGKRSSEIKELIQTTKNKFGYTLHDISSKLEVTEAALSRWNNGKSIPSKKNLEKLKQLASGKIESAKTEKEPTMFDLMYMQGKFEGKIEGTLKQLTDQIALLQGQRDKFEGRLKAIEEKPKEDIKKKTEYQTEQSSS